jgi:hypothetical protein
MAYGTPRRRVDNCIEEVREGATGAAMVRLLITEGPYLETPAHVGGSWMLEVGWTGFFQGYALRFRGAMRLTPGRRAERQSPEAGGGR